MSDLETSAHEGHQLPPRRLEPITNPVVAKKRKRVKKKDKPPPTTAEDQTLATTASATGTGGSPSLLGESMLSRLRTRLDPLYNTSSPPPLPSESSPLPPVRLPPLEHPTSSPHLPTTTDGRGSERAGAREDTSVREGDTTEGSTSHKGSHRRTKRKKNDTQEASQSPGQPSGATANEDVMSEQKEELKSTSREALIAGATGGSERKKRRRRERERERSRRTSGRSVSESAPDTGEEITAEVIGEGLDSTVDDGVPTPTNEDTGRQSRGRQLPAPPSFDVEDSLEPPISTMADELATTGGLPTANARGEFVHPDDPQFLVSEEDIVEVEPDELQGTTRLFQPALQPHTSASQPKDVIFVERRDGRGFAAQRKGAVLTSRDEVERGIFSGENEISSMQFAIYSHKVIQHLSVIAHGLVAGISLWDCVVSNVLSRSGSGLHLDLLTHYHPLTLPANAVYIFLLSIVMLSLLDRFDFASLNREYLQNFFKTPVQIILLIAFSLVFIALILTLSIAAVDERIALYPHQPSLWVDVLTPINTTTTPTPSTPVPTTHTDTSLSLVYVPGNNLTSSRVTPWLALAIVRAICCSISWILVVWISDFDRLLDYLNSIEKEDSDAPSTKE